MKTMTEYTADEMMTVAAARELKDGAVCFVGIGLPSAAANLARLTHAPNVVLVYESGTVDTKPDVLPLSIGDGELAETATAVVSTAEIFRYWLQGGRIDIGFLGAAQIDRYANLNTTVRLPGAGGAPEIAASAKEVLIILRQNKRSFVSQLDFLTSVGHGSGPSGRQQLGLTTAGPTTVITDLCIMHPDPATGELEVASLHPGISEEKVRSSTGWDLKWRSKTPETAAPTEAELTVLRALQERTARAHRGEA
jgi:glutaconate CoA-transferase, subunit B